MDHSQQHIPSNRVLDFFANAGNLKKPESVTKALASGTRPEILNFLGACTCTVLEISEALHLPQSTATMHINVLERAELIKTNIMPASRGLQKICSRVYDRVIIQIPTEFDTVGNTIIIPKISFFASATAANLRRSAPESPKEVNGKKVSGPFSRYQPIRKLLRYRNRR